MPYITNRLCIPKSSSFSGTIESNVAYGDNGRNNNLQNNVIDAIYTAQASDFVEGFTTPDIIAMLPKAVLITQVGKSNVPLLLVFLPRIQISLSWMSQRRVWMQEQPILL